MKRSNTVQKDIGDEPFEPPPAPDTARYIVTMTRELKKVAANSGLIRVALMLEMAELEASDYIRERS